MPATRIRRIFRTLPCTLLAATSIVLVLHRPARAASNDEIAAAFRDLYVLSGDDSASALVVETAARAPDVLSALIRAAVRSERAADPASRADAELWNAAAAAFAAISRAERVDPIVDSVWAIASAWGPAERREKARAESLYISGYAAYAAQQFDGARRDFDDAAAAYRKIGDRYRIGSLEMNAGLALAELGQLPEAGARLRAAIRAFDLIGDRRGEGRAFGHLAAVESESGRYQEAEVLFADALRAVTDSAEPGREAELRNNLGNLLLARGRFRQAGSEYEKSIALYKSVGDAALGAAALQNLGIIQQMLGDMRGARRTLEACLAVARATDDAPLASHAQSNLANVLFALGEAARADSLHRAALAHDAAVGDAGALVVDLENLARLLVSRGDYSSAADTIASAIRLCEERGLERERIYLRLTQAAIAREVNELDDAARELEDAAVAARRLGDRAAEGQALGQHGSVQALRGDLVSARELLTAAAAAHRETGEVLRLLETENLRANTELLAGDLLAADRAADSAKAIASRAGNVTEGARTLWVAARIAAARGRLNEARTLLDRAAEKLPPHFEQDLAWQIELARADVAERAGDTTGALAHLASGIEIVEDVRRGVTGHRERSRYVEDKEVLYHAAVSLLLALRRAEDAFAIAERARARGFLDLASAGSGEALVRGASANAQDLRSARQRVAALVTRWEALEEGGILSEETEAATALGIELHAAYADYERTVGPALRAVSKTAGAEPADPASIRRALPGGSALVEYFFARDGLVAFVATRTALKTFDLRTTRRETADLIRITRALAEDPRSDRGRLDPLLVRVSSMLLDTLFADGVLDRCTRLFVVPHAELHLLPFAALPVARASSRLIDMCEVAVLPSASLLVVRAAAGNAAARSSPGPLLALGGVAADRGVVLPFSKNEVTRIADASANLRPATLLTGRRADETAWKLAAPAAGLIHIATHSHLTRGSPLFSSLEMSPSSDDDGHLEVHEILRLNLSADVAVLSGCETAQASGYAADLPPGDEIVGLARAFLSAGARTVVATLWPVRDRAAADFMVEFHAALAGFDPIGALARTQRRWARASDHRAHPFYWSSAVAMGCGG